MNSVAPKHTMTLEQLIRELCRPLTPYQAQKVRLEAYAFARQRRSVGRTIEQALAGAQQDFNRIGGD